MRYLRRLARRLAVALLNFNKHDGWLVAGGISYFLAMSLFPLLLVLVAVLGWAFEWTHSGQNAEQRIMAAVQEQASPALREQLQRALDSISGHAAAGGPVGFALLVIAAIAMFVQFDRAFDHIWEVHSGHTIGWVQWLVGRLFARLKALGMLLAATIFIVVVMAASLAGRRLLPMLTPTAINLLLNLAALAVIYRFVPKPEVRWSEAIRGGIVAALLWEIGRATLTWYLTRHDSLSAYGIIGSFLAVMLWAYYATLVVFYGAEYVREVQKEARPIGKDAPNGSAHLRDAKRANSE
jgi:membrane protein